jgi:GT2 family glycosyltransferase
MKSAHKVSIGSCDPGTVNGAFAYRLIQLAQARSARLGPFVRVKGSGLLSKQRNRVVKQFLDGTKSDWLLLIDSDEQLTLEAFDKLLETAHDKERPVVAGLVFAGFGIEGAPYPKPVPAIFQDAPEGFLPLYKYDKNSVFEIDAAGTGCLLIHRSVLEKMRETADKNQGTDWCWFWDGPVDGNWIGEDLLFCRRIRALGFPIYVNTGAILPHQKSYWLDERHHQLWKD